MPKCRRIVSSALAMAGLMSALLLELVDSQALRLQFSGFEMAAQMH